MLLTTQLYFYWKQIKIIFPKSRLFCPWWWLVNYLSAMSQPTSIFILFSPLSYWGGSEGLAGWGLVDGQGQCTTFLHNRSKKSPRVPRLSEHSNKTNKQTKMCHTQQNGPQQRSDIRFFLKDFCTLQKKVWRFQPRIFLCMRLIRGAALCLSLKMSWSYARWTVIGC